MDEPAQWRKWPKVSPARSGGANSKVYPKCEDPDCDGWWHGPHDYGQPCPICREGDHLRWMDTGSPTRNLLTRDPECNEDDEPIGCLWCGEDSTRLCDTLLRERDEKGDLGFYKATCDAPLCESCTGQMSTVFMSGPGGHLVDTIDACPYCVARAGHRRGRRNSNTWRETDYVSATLWRERRDVQARRARMNQ